MVSELLTIETIGVAGLSLFVIDKLFKVIMAKKSGNGESTLKNESRDRILETKNNIKDVQNRQKSMMPDFYEQKGQVKAMHKIITATGNSGAPKVYNPDLHAAITGLTNAVERLANKGN